MAASISAFGEAAKPQERPAKARLAWNNVVVLAGGGAEWGGG